MIWSRVKRLKQEIEEGERQRITFWQKSRCASREAAPWRRSSSAGGGGAATHTSPPQSQQWPPCPCFPPHLQSYNLPLQHTHIHTLIQTAVFTLCGSVGTSCWPQHRHTKTPRRPQTLKRIDSWSHGSFHTIRIFLNGHTQSDRLELAERFAQTGD